MRYKFAGIAKTKNGDFVGNNIPYGKEFPAVAEVCLFYYAPPFGYRVCYAYVDEGGIKRRGLRHEAFDIKVAAILFAGALAGSFLFFSLLHLFI